MIDRERLLAADHQARLLGEAEARRQATLAQTAQIAAQRHPMSTVRTALGRWLVATGSRLAPEPDPCGPAARGTA